MKTIIKLCIITPVIIALFFSAKYLATYEYWENRQKISYNAELEVAELCREKGMLSSWEYTEGKLNFEHFKEITDRARHSDGRNIPGLKYSDGIIKKYECVFNNKIITFEK